ncbi:MAG TPA: hypothetical protein VHD57_07935 [Vicinamibacterales bacterium]|jgi:hypothetical protein|nr:hypothetical protein [Vicinamibacterales bacterium]
MRRINGTTALQLNLLDDEPGVGPRRLPDQVARPLRVIQKDVYAELERRRRRAQIAARRRVEGR